MTNNTGATCVRCGKGHYKALDLNDAIFGDLHCDNCGHYVKFNQDLEEIQAIAAELEDTNG